MTALNKVQLEILRQFDWCKSDEDLKNLRKLLKKFWLEKAVDAADKASLERGYNRETFEGFMNEHMRSKSKNE
jgi:hypothetical protein